MKTKTLKSFLMLMMLAGLILFVSCQKENLMSPAPVNKEVSTSQDAVIPNPEALQLPAITEATLESEFAFAAELENEAAVIILDETTLQFNTRHRDFKDFVYFLNSLKLNREQAHKLLRAINAYLDCRHYLLGEINKEIKKILTKGNIERQRLLHLYRKGEINRQQLDRLMSALNMKIRKELNDSPVIARLKMALDKCHREFMEHARLILNKDQWEKWVRYFKLKTGEKQ